ncbi:small heat shock protein, chloroplastic [Beta vulgaris subsp. vulgaris]|uniref:small heat shock protein, chloroplastic n=1 Tax=Beta vulgaris subsp. vulgaris TaxID=3555 RepID=UPI002036A3E8|nr:small heat shock protein, chloroplastic [Beta vulgaris subsp. vulgaris]
MASNVLTCSASTLVSNNRALGSPSLIGPGPRSAVSLTPPLKAPSSRPSGLVVKAQQGGSPRNVDPLVTDHFHKKVALLDTNPYVRTPWNTSEDDHEIRMWFDMPGLAGENIDVNIVDDLLVIKGDGGVDAFGNKIFSPYDSRVQLPFNSWKEEVTAVFKNGVLYITVPKITKIEHKIIHIPVRSV